MKQPMTMKKTMKITIILVFAIQYINHELFDVVTVQYFCRLRDLFCQS